MTAQVEQRIMDWAGWPDDVRPLLIEWNADFLLSFRRGPDFFCLGCNRGIAAHPNGNAVVRPRRKAHGVLCCEDCLITLARENALPPAWLEPLKPGVRVERHLRDRIDALEKRVGRLRMQLELDQAYMDRLEAEIPADRLAAIRDELRGRNRRPR